ncbi:peptidase domain-containing ABC transporter [Lusitaniella coriacea LEGE 07157]|uniref:Peptidase domain-containing ABC transporter n=1 Tax=Lusitaniella coriacea LEGE 07157 TaxID=945747 RepID=A0A8J7DZB3_9CYAN|nr:peptidase domain-containing ABC transporter [Lusitaniella coriacea]MBE9116501.1 peptidase domain-containing ABC transporter [Lusitaniella coriacea LEGE 07157]
MTVNSPNIQEFLAVVPPFNRLSNKVLIQIAKKFEVRRYSMGEEIAIGTMLPSEIAIVYQGNVRLLGYEPNTQMPIALTLLEPGEMVGWAGLIRGIPTETAIASTDLLTLTLPAEDFLGLLRKHPILAEYFQETPALNETFEFLHQAVQQQAKLIENVQRLALEVHSNTIVCNLPPGKSLEKHLDSERLWFLSSGRISGKRRELPPGSPLNRDFSEGLKVAGDRPARLIGLPKSVISHQRLTARQMADGSRQMGKTHADKEREEVSEESSVNSGEDRRGEEDAETRGGGDTESNGRGAMLAPRDSTPHQNYPFFRGRRGAVDATLACFTMLAQYFRIPFRREIVQRLLIEQMQRRGSLSLNACGSVAELMGLNIQLLQVPPSAVTRLHPPALIYWEDSVAILYEARDRVMVIANPREGIETYSPEEFIEKWDKRGQVLLLQPGKETPQQHFGWQWFLPALFKYRKVLFLVLLASFFVQLFGLANPLIIQLIIDQVIVKGSFDTLDTLGIFLLAVAVFEALLSSLRTYLFVDTTNRIDLTLGTKIIDRLLRLPLRYFERRPVGELSSRINELENIRSFLTGTALTAVLDAVFSVIYVIVMLFYSWKLTIVALSTIPIFVLIAAFFSPIVRKQLRTKAERNAKTQSYLVEVVSGIQTVKAQNIESRSRWRWQDYYARYVTAGFRTVITSTTASAISNFLNKFSGLLVLWFGASLVLKGQLTLGELIAFRIIASYVTGPVLRLGQLWQNFQETALSLERIADIIDTPQEAEKDRRNIPMPNLQGAVKYENISFRFRSGDTLQLDNVNLEVKAGQFVGIVGQSGAGKSTLTKLLVRLYEPDAGRISIDNYDISKVELYSLRRQLGVVPQDTLLFDGTVEDNIRLTNPDATTEEVIEAAKIAAAHDFIMNLPNGYDTRVGERGSALSGGQRQRIAIARTILQNPQLLILDEATSALDYPTERQVCENLARAFANTTVFFITHRLGTVKNADLIVVMDKGNVAEQGNHAELMAMKGRYYCLYQHQDFVTR